MGSRRRLFITGVSPVTMGDATGTEVRGLLFYIFHRAEAMLPVIER